MENHEKQENGINIPRIVKTMSEFVSFFLKQLEPMVVTIDVSLEELYKKVIKKIVVKIKRITGEDRVNLYLSLLNYQDSYIYKNKGDEFFHIEKKCIQQRDIIIKINILPHETISIDTCVSKYDLCIEKPLTLYKLYYGFEDTIDYLGSQLKIKFEGKDSPGELTEKYGSILVVKNRGLPYVSNDEELRGNLYIHLRLHLPVLKRENNELNNLMKTYFDANVYKDNFNTNI